MSLEADRDSRRGVVELREIPEDPFHSQKRGMAVDYWSPKQSLAGVVTLFDRNLLVSNALGERRLNLRL